jgi:hypothetical protein
MHIILQERTLENMLVSIDESTKLAGIEIKCPVKVHAEEVGHPNPSAPF